MVRLRYLRSAKAFTVVELMVVCAVLGLLAALAYPQLSRINAQMKVSEDARVVAHMLGQLRGEAIRLRANVRVRFTAGGMQWDVYDDGEPDGTLRMNRGTSWQGSGLPGDILFNGLGLVRGIGGSSRQLRLNNSGQELTVNINSNGHIDI